MTLPDPPIGSKSSAARASDGPVDDGAHPLRVSSAPSTELAECHRRLELVRQLLHTLIYVFDLETGAIDWVNDRLPALLGYEPDEIIALGPNALAALMHPDDRAHVHRMLARWSSVDDHTVLEAEYRLRHRDGSWRHFLGRDAVYTRRPDGRPHQIIGTTTDVTARRELERHAARAARLDAVTRMAGGIALDFNDLLTAVLGNVALARAPLDEGADPRPHLDELQRVTARATATSRQLMGLARLQPSTPEVIELGRFLRDNAALVTRLAHSAAPGTEAPRLLVTADETWPIRVDTTQLTQMLVALVGLAEVPSAGAGTTVALTCERLSVGVATGRLAVGRWVKLAMVLGGEAVDADTLARALDPVRTPSMGRVGGAEPELGLGAVYGIVRQHHGLLEIRAEADPGSGPRTHIEIYLPALDEAALEPPRARVDAPLRPRPDSGALVIVAEDEAMVAELTRRILTHAGHRVLLCADGIDALEAIRKHQDEVALVISDIVMPRLSGLELARQLATELPDLPLLLASGYPEDERRLNDHMLSQVAFLPKPFRAADLLQAVAQLLEHHARKGTSERLLEA